MRTVRTVTFKSVFEGILRRAGMDPRGDAVATDTGLSICEHANARVRRAWFLWEFPEWTFTEERAYRQIWNDSRQFYLAGPDGTPDEVFYIPNVATHSLTDAAYYRVKESAPENPPLGTPPSDTTYWEKMDSVEPYIAYDQVCRRRIGEVLDVYGNNPFVVAPPECNCLDHRPTENGIEICGGGGLLTVFVRYLIPAERFTTFPYIPSRTYLRGDLVYVAAQGECYQAIQVALNKDPVTETSYWRRCLFPEVLAEYVKAGAYADTLRETDTSDERDPVMLQIRGQKIGMADAEAEDEINRQFNRLQAQGQHYFYLPFGVMVGQRGRTVGGVCSIPRYVLQGAADSNYGPLAATGTGTTTISDQCETEWGYIPPAPPAVVVLVPIANQRGSVQLVMGQSYVDVVFHSSQTNSNWILVSCEIVNTTDSTPLNISPGIITSRTLTGFRIQLEGVPETNNYFLQWAINGNIVPPTPAITYALSGPGSGHIGGAVTFTAALLPDTTVADPVTITPSDGGAGGTFTPTTVELTTADPSATFTYTPALAGTKTISVTNDGGLLNPAGITFVVSAATAYSLSGPSGGEAGVASTPFTVGLLPLGFGVPAPVTITPSAGGGGGTFTPATVALTTGSPSATFTYTPASAGTKTISGTNSGGLTNPGSISYVATPPPFSPDTIAGLKLWFKADSLALSDGTAVSTWADSSSNGNNATQTGANRPVYKTSIVNGKPVVRFDGADDYMVLTSETTFGPAFTALVVHKTTGDVCLFGAASVNNQIIRVGETGVNQLSIFDGVVGYKSVTNLSVPRSSWNIACLRRTAAGNLDWIDASGLLINSSDGTSTMKAGVLGAVGSPPLGLYTNGDVAEILLYDAWVPDVDLTNLSNYLKTKYGIP